MQRAPWTMRRPWRRRATRDERRAAEACDGAWRLLSCLELDLARRRGVARSLLETYLLLVYERAYYSMPYDDSRHSIQLRAAVRTVQATAVVE